MELLNSDNDIVEQCEFITVVNRLLANIKINEVSNKTIILVQPNDLREQEVYSFREYVAQHTRKYYPNSIVSSLMYIFLDGNELSMRVACEPYNYDGRIITITGSQEEIKTLKNILETCKKH